MTRLMEVVLCAQRCGTFKQLLFSMAVVGIAGSPAVAYSTGGFPRCLLQLMASSNHTCTSNPAVANCLPIFGLV